MIVIGIAVAVVHPGRDLRIVFGFRHVDLLILREQFADRFTDRRMPAYGAAYRIVKRQVAGRGGAQREFGHRSIQRGEHLAGGQPFRRNDLRFIFGIHL